VIAITDTASGIGAVNPLLYRGYYYDAELGMYYLQSRYYDPAVKRFVNADSMGNP
jgi:RHS repeat-associated protein